MRPIPKMPKEAKMIDKNAPISNKKPVKPSKPTKYCYLYKSFWDDEETETIVFLNYKQARAEMDKEIEYCKKFWGYSCGDPIYTESGRDGDDLFWVHLAFRDMDINIHITEIELRED